MVSQVILLCVTAQTAAPVSAGVAAEKKIQCLQFIDLVHELIEDVVTRQLLDGLAVDKQHCLALAAGNADVGLAGLTGAVDNTAHNGHLDGFL